MKLLKRTLIGFALLLCVLAVTGYMVMRRSLAPLDGTLKIQNLSHPVTVTRDAYGIPHIKAQTKLDALRALGFVQASERLFQLELSRRLTQGTLSEVFGPLAVKNDTLYRNLMLKRSMERMLQAEKEQGRFDAQLWNEMEAYFDGINQYIAHFPLPYEMTLLRMPKPAPFTPLDAYIMTGHMAYSFGIALKADPVMTELAKKLPREQFQTLRNDPLQGPLHLAAYSLPRPLDLGTEGLFAPVFEGSNAWLIAPSRSQSGKSIFANDPHIGFSAPAVWFEAHLQTPEFEIYGHYLPLVPFAVLGHTSRHAWGFTMSLADDMDLYRETLDTKNKTVLYQNEPVPYQEWQEVIKVKGEPDVVLTMIETPHGPLLNEVLDEKNLALKWAFHKLENNPMKALQRMGEAKTMAEFESALQFATAPGLNVMYADPENIAWWVFGDMAVKQNPHSDLILDGASGKDEYARLLTWQEKPHLVNPPSGVIVTANSRPPGLPATIRGDWQSDDRYQTITEALSQKERWNVEDTKVLQTENYNAQNKKILAQLLSQVRDDGSHEKQIQLLKEWNLRSEITSQAASLYHQWNNENILLMLASLDEKTRTAYLNTPYAWVFYERAILNPSSAWWSDKNYSDIINQGFRNATKALASLPEWGRLHTIEYVHPLGRIAPLNKIFNLGPYPMPGSYNDINNNKMRALGGDFKVVAGPSTRRIIDFANPQKSWGINPIGTSGHMLSPFYKDQAHMFLEGRYREQLMNDADIERVKTHVLVLE